MDKINLFVEGKTDEEFIEALISTHLNSSISHVVYQLDGNHERIHEHTDRLREGLLNLFILDSDSNSKEQVDQQMFPVIEMEAAYRRNVRYDIFLIEDNLEFLAKRIIPQEKTNLWSCIDTYAQCNASIQSELIRPVDSKTKVYIYVNAHKVPVNYKKREFSNPEIWNLQHEAVNPLVTFLKSHLE